jgi:nitrogenase molybdenum-cofactor synthesis protein NifE
MERRILNEREGSIVEKAKTGCSKEIKCGVDSVSGAVSQRACVYCGARVVLNPIVDAFHIVHGPIGCASYTWDIRGSLTSGSELYRQSFSTDLQERDIIFGGAQKLEMAISEVVEHYKPKLIFIYSTCIVGVIGDDVEAVCRMAEETYNIRCISVKAPGFAGHKALGYKMACNAIMEVMRGQKKHIRDGINILGDYNLAGEIWILQGYMKKIGIPVVSTITGDATYEKLLEAPSARLNIVQCAGSMVYLANRMEEEFGIPWVKVSFFGIQDVTESIMKVANYTGRPEVIKKAEEFTSQAESKASLTVAKYRRGLYGKKAAIFVGGGFKAISLIRQFNELGIETVVVGTQTGRADEYELIGKLVGENTVILDDANPAELETFIKEKGADILVGGVKERPLAYKLGIAFCDHNHERRHPLSGYEGIENFCREINSSINSPVWGYAHKPGPMEDSHVS